MQRWLVGDYLLPYPTNGGKTEETNEFICLMIREEGRLWQLLFSMSDLQNAEPQQISCERELPCFFYFYFFFFLLLFLLGSTKIYFNLFIYLSIVHVLHIYNFNPLHMCVFLFSNPPTSSSSNVCVCVCIQAYTYIHIDIHIIYVYWKKIWSPQNTRTNKTNGGHDHIMKSKSINQ